MNRNPVFVITGILSAGMLAVGLASADDLNFEVAGLENPAEIVVDEWGVPHIYANSHYDAFFVQGFNAARDRLWQIDTWRRRGLGKLAEVFGETYIEQDRAARLFLYRGDMYREWLAYGSDAKAIAESFTSGINAYIDLIESNSELLPPEFTLMRYRPDHWSAADVVRIRGHGLWGNVGAEVMLARTTCKASLEIATQAFTLEPEWTTRIPEGLDPCSIPENVLDVYYLAKAPVEFANADTARDTGLTDRDGSGLGSNNWVVAPSRTATGRPVLADDPHRTHAVPSLRYISHLVAPGLNVIGAGEPALPGISIGHNDHIAFGLTIFPIDQEDLYVYEKAADGYRYGDSVLNSTQPESKKLRSATLPMSARRWSSRGTGRLCLKRRSCFLRFAQHGWSRGWRPTSAASSTCELKTGANSWQRSIAGERHLKTRFMPTLKAILATSLPACFHGGRAGTVFCRCRVTADSNGRVSSTWMYCRLNSTRSGVLQALPIQ